MPAPSRRAALYARFSTDLQSDKSVDDQLDLCTAFARAQGWTIAEQHHDRARTGTTTHGRDGLSRLLDGARAGRFDTIVVEALDRLSRDQEDLAGLHKRLTFLGVQIVAVHDGVADQVQVGIRGLVSALFITDLKHKIRRGMGGVVADGRVAGGKAYGYRPVPGRPGEPEIDEAEAAVVRRIFTEYAAGVSPREIAAGLNADCVAPPRKGGTWNASTINGNAARGSGILHNRLYVGEIVWNRLRMVRDPDTGKRISRENPPEEWRRADAPHLRIVSQDVWDQVQGRNLPRQHHSRRHETQKGRRLLSGLLRCGCCGGGLSSIGEWRGQRRAKCSRHQESRGCANGKRYDLRKIEGAVIQMLAERLGQPDAARAWIESVQADERDGAKRRAKAERALREAEAKVERLQVMLIDGRIDPAFFDRQIGPARAEVAARAEELKAAPATNVVTLHPGALAGMAEVLSIMVAELPDADPVADRDAIEAVRSLIKHVRVIDREDGGVDCEITGTIAPLVAQSVGGADGSGGPSWSPPPDFQARVRAA